MSRVKRSLLQGDFYKSYRKYCKRKGLQPLPATTYRRTLRQMGDIMSEILIQEGIIGLPRMIGEVYFKRSKTEEVAKNGKQLLFNEHTEGYIYRLHWDSPERVMKTSKLWCFSGFRGMKRDSAQLLIHKKVRYPDFQLLNPRSVTP